MSSKALLIPAPGRLGVSATCFSVITKSLRSTTLLGASSLASATVAQLPPKKVGSLTMEMATTLDSSYSCNMLSCFEWRGPTECVKDESYTVFKNRCHCKPGYCSVCGICMAQNATSTDLDAAMQYAVEAQAQYAVGGILEEPE